MTATRLVVITSHSEYDLDTEAKCFRRNRSEKVDDIVGTNEWMDYTSLVQLEVGRPMILHYRQGDKVKARVTSLVVAIKEPEED